MLLCCATARLAAESNYELAVAAKMSEIKWRQADLQAAQREAAILGQFLDGYEAKTTDLSKVRQQLAGADTQLASIQRDNLVKLTIRMGISTYTTVSDTINFAKTTATALVTNGLASTVGDAAMDELSGGLTDQAKAALGIDDDTLLKPRTVKIKAVSDAARAAYPGLARVQQSLALSLEAVKIAASKEDPGTELGDTGAILRKNIMVRDEIAAALAKLDTLGTEAAAAKTAADSDLITAQADVDRITAELAELNTELNALKAEWSATEDAARLAANQAALVPPVHQPPPSVSLVKGEPESEYDYNVRVAAAVAAAAQARWDTEAPAILTAIASSKTQIEAAQSAIEADFTTYIEDTSVDSFISSYGGNDQVDANTTASYLNSISSYTRLEQWITAVTPAATALPGLISQVETLTDRYTALVNQQNQLVSLREMLSDSGVWATPNAYSPALVIPGMGQKPAENLAVSLDQYLSQLPQALANAGAQLDQLADATDAWSSGIGSVRSDLDDNLAAAETALAELRSRATAWDAMLAASPGLALDFANGFSMCRLGTFSGTDFTPVVQHAFDMPTYKASLLAAVATPGAAGLAGSRELRAKYDAIVAAAPAIKDAYDAAWQKYQSTYARVLAYAGSSLQFPVYQDWSGAATYTSVAHPVDASGVTDQAARFLSLYYTSNQSHVTGIDGGAPVVGQPVLFWWGLPQLRQLPDPGLDEPAKYLPHRLVAAKAIIVEDGPGWIALAPEAFNTHYGEATNQVWQVYNEASDAWDEASATASLALLGELSTLNNAYVAAHPAATITVQPAGSVNSIPAGTTHSAQLSVTATGDFLTYQWSVTRWTNDSYGWADIPGATSSTLTTSPLTETRWFRVTITNPGGAVTSEAAHVEVYKVYPGPVFTSAASATAQVGVQFSWTFTTEPASWVSSSNLMSLPPGLTFNFTPPTLEGTPTAAGAWDLGMIASNMGTFGFQTFSLTVEPGTLAPFDAWVQDWTTPEQRLDPAFTKPDGVPARDGVPNLLKYAFNLLGSGPGQAASLGIPCTTSATPSGNVGLPACAVDGSGHLTLCYIRRKAAAISYAIEYSNKPGVDPWAVNADTTETVSSIDDTWERVVVTDSIARAASRFIRVRVSQL